MSELIKMVEGGQWLADGEMGVPMYVVEEAHIKRLLHAGYQVIPDPRVPAQEAVPETEKTEGNPQSALAEKEPAEPDSAGEAVEPTPMKQTGTASEPPAAQVPEHT